MPALEPVGERAGGRLLERPEEHDHEQEERGPEDGDEAVRLRPERPRREDVVGVGEDARRERGAREERGAVEAARRPAGALGDGDGAVDGDLGHPDSPLRVVRHMSASWAAPRTG